MALDHAINGTHSMSQRFAGQGFDYCEKRLGRLVLRGELARKFISIGNHNAGIQKRIRAFVRQDQELTPDAAIDTVLGVSMALLDDLWDAYSEAARKHRNLEHEIEDLKAAKKRQRSITPKMRAEVFERDGHKCLLCESSERLTIDHIVPFSQGGACSVDNFQTLCMPCNRLKFTQFLDLREGA